MNRIMLVSVAILIGWSATNAAAQDGSAVEDRQFIFSVSTPPTDSRHAVVYVDTGFGSQAFDVIESQRPEQRIGIQAALGHRFTFLGRVGISSDEQDVQSSQQGEVQVPLLAA